jgi:uncharacterized membrane protein
MTAPISDVLEPSTGVTGRVVWTVTIVAGLLYGWYAVAAHLSLRTNAFDLSLFDYALWTSLHGRLGYVPFIGHSIFSEHFVPILMVLLPVYSLWQSPWTLLVIQVLAIAGAVWSMGRLMVVYRLEPFAAVAAAAAFVLSKKSYEAFSSFFYPECLQPLLAAGCVWGWLRSQTLVYWLCVVLLLSTKEEVAIYLAAFGLVQSWLAESSSRRRTGVATVCVAVVWLVIAIAVGIPAVRHAEGLPGWSHFIDARYGSEQGLQSGIILRRVFSMSSLSKCFNLLGSFGFLSAAAPEWLIVIVPGLVLSLAAKPDSGQSAMMGHYFWPFLPWLAISAIAGIRRLQRSYPRVATTWCALLLLAVVADSPIFRSAAPFRVDPAAGEVRRGLPLDTTGMAVAAQPNLVPHLPHSWSVRTIGPDQSNPSCNLVLLTSVGDTWPFTAQEISALADDYNARGEYEALSDGPLFVFRRR